MRKHRHFKIYIIGVIFLLTVSGMFSQAINIKIEEKQNINSLSRQEWWDADWEYRKLITIDSSQIGSTLTNFPVLINELTDSDLATYAQDDGDDIVFVFDNGNIQLNHEIEYFNPTTGKLAAWVCVPSLSSTADTLLWMYYGNPDCQNQQNIQAVWGTDHLMVHHLNETVNPHEDSSSSDNDGYGTNGVNMDVSGKIDGADYFAGDDDYVYTFFDSDTEIGDGNPFTIEAWSFAEETVAEMILGGTTDTERFYFGTYLGYWRWGIGSEYTTNTGVPAIANEWQHVAWVFDGTSVKIYLNGFLSNDKTYTGDGDLPYIYTSIGAVKRQDGTYGNYYNGKIDEVRVSNVARSSDWINATYINSNDPTSFLTIGSQEQFSKIEIINPVPPDGATNVELIPTLQITVTHDLGELMNIVWKWNNQGTWETFAENNNIGNGTYSQVNSEFSEYLTTYMWRVEVSDNIGNLEIATFSFTTLGGTDKPVVNITKPTNGYLYLNLFGNLMEIPFRPAFFTLIIGANQIEVDAHDTDGIAWVKIYINEELQATLTESPYTWLWSEQTIFFPYTINATACDNAGNKNSDEIKVWKMQFF